MELGSFEKKYIEKHNCKLFPKKDVPLSKVRNLTKDELEQYYHLLLNDKDALMEAFIAYDCLAIIIYPSISYNAYLFNCWSNTFTDPRILLLNNRPNVLGRDIRDRYFCFVNIPDSLYIKLKLSL